MHLTASRLNEIFLDCLYKQEEIPEGEVPKDAIVARGIAVSFPFHPERIAQHQAEISDMIDDLPKDFMMGQSFLNLCMTKHHLHWGEHRNCEQLVTLGIATGRMGYCAPPTMWYLLPGGMPYVQVFFKKEPTKTDACRHCESIEEHIQTVDGWQCQCCGHIEEKETTT